MLVVEEVEVAKLVLATLLIVVATTAVVVVATAAVIVKGGELKIP